jgi:putative endonuclease
MGTNGYEKKIGDLGEEAACKYLLAKDYVIAGRNYFTRRGEIDIIAYFKKELVFVEVKSRKSYSFGPIESQVSPKKINRILQAAEEYIIEHNISDTDCRVDLISVFMDGSAYDNFYIEHFENISFH